MSFFGRKLFIIIFVVISLFHLHTTFTEAAAISTLESPSPSPTKNNDISDGDKGLSVGGTADVPIQPHVHTDTVSELPLSKNVLDKIATSLMVETPSSGSIPINASLDMTVIDLKTKMVDLLKMSTSKFYLMSGNVKLNDEMTLKAQGVGFDDPIKAKLVGAISTSLKDNLKAPGRSKSGASSASQKGVNKHPSIPNAESKSDVLGLDKPPGYAFSVVPGMTDAKPPTEPPTTELPTDETPTEKPGEQPMTETPGEQPMTETPGEQPMTEKPGETRRLDGKRQSVKHWTSRQRPFESHLRPNCNLANDGPKRCARDDASYGMLMSYETRRNQATLAFVTIIFLLAIGFQSIIRCVTTRVEKSGDRFLKDVLEAIFRQISTMMLVISTILICLQLNIIEHKLDHRIFSDIMKTFPTMQQWFNESHLEMIFDEMLLITMDFTMVYVACTLFYVLIARDSLSWLKNAENTDHEKIFRSKKLLSNKALVNYQCLRYEFRDHVESTSVPGLDPSGYYFMEYCRARLLKITVEMLRIPNSILVAALGLCFLLFPMAHWRHLNEVLLVIGVSAACLLVAALLLVWLFHLEKQLIPKDPVTYLTHRSMVDLGNCHENLELIHNLGPSYKVDEINRKSWCSACWMKMVYGTLYPTRHEYIFAFWKRGPALLFRTVEFIYFVQMVNLANFFYLADRHPGTWWELYGPWAPIAIATIVAVQFGLVPVIVWKLLIVTSTSEMIDESVLREVWEHQRAETVRRAAQFVDQIRMDSTIYAITSGGESYWSRLLATLSILPLEVEAQNAEIFDKLDDDKDGLLTPPQFSRWITSQGFNVPNDREMRRWFDAFDYDKKGCINRGEFSIVVLVVKRLLTEPMDKDEIKRLLARKYGLPAEDHILMDLRSLVGILKEMNLEWRSGQIKHFLEYMSGSRNSEVSIPEFVNKLALLETETLATLQQAVSQLRSKSADIEPMLRPLVPHQISIPPSFV